MTDVTIVHDYLTQRGGAERVVLALCAAFPEAPVVTSLFDPPATFPEFSQLRVHTLPIDRVAALRHNHRLALPLLAPCFSAVHIDSPVAVCSSSGWAHGVHATGKKIVYCHNPPRWLYQTATYLGGFASVARPGLAALRPALARWDIKAAQSADVYVANSAVVRQRILEAYGIEAEVVHPPFTLDSTAETSPISGLDAGFFLCVSRLLSYKNVDAVIGAFRHLPHERLVVIGNGPLEAALRSTAPANVTMHTTVDDATLRWAYKNCRAVVAASYEDFGLTPLEGATFGKPTVALRWGGFLETVRPDATGVFFDTVDPRRISQAVRQLSTQNWDDAEIRAWADTFSIERFIRRMRSIVADQMKAVAESL
jgi:glycosyltransferase involved in cell wall biosynthesis